MLHAMANKSILLVALMAIVLAAIAKPQRTQTPEIASPQIAPAAASIDSPSAANTRAIADASNAFAVDLWQRVGKTPGNLSISPGSISAALAMTWGGAKGQTAEGIGKVLHIPEDAKTAGEAWGSLIRALEDPARPFTLRIANRLFGEKTFAFEQPFLEWTEAAYGAALEPMDFMGAAETSRTHINAWVDERTEHRILDLLPFGSIDTNSRLILVNAIYFHADWAWHFFVKEATSPAPFFTSPSVQHDVPTMHASSSFRAAESNGVKVLELEYKGGDVAMMVVLPNKVDGLADIEKNMTADTIASWTKGLASKPEVIVSLPNFELNPPEPIQLRNDLAALGMPEAFDREKSDFSGIANSPDPRNRLYVSAIYHKAFVKVDEKGTEAAAATDIISDTPTPMPAPMPFNTPPPPFVFRADHPFLFFIIDKPSGLILFMGRVSDPLST